MEYTDTQLAKALGIDRTTAWRWRKDGMPSEDLELAKAWAQNRKPKPKINVAPKPVMETFVGDKKLTLHTGEKVETAYDVRDRLQAQERTIAAEVRPQCSPGASQARQR